MKCRNIFVSAVFALFCLVCGAVEHNSTLSPDGRYRAYTGDDNNLYVEDLTCGEVRKITSDGSPLILNGYASWVYYEEIFGRPSKYRAFWWSPDSQKIAFYRFDNTAVPMYPIYSPFGEQGGSLSQTRYPLAGQPNPSVRIGIAHLDGEVVWADFDEKLDQYFGTPFWGDDSARLFVQWMPRVQQDLKLYSVNVLDGSKTLTYSEHYDTWIDWMDDMLFAHEGLYMTRDFETGWQQIYYLSYDGRTCRRLTDGPNWNVSLVRVNERSGEVYFTAHRDSDVHDCLYKVDRKGRITLLTDSNMNVDYVRIADDFRSFEVRLSSRNDTPKLYRYSGGRRTLVDSLTSYRKSEPGIHYELIYLTLSDGLKVPAHVVYPKDFDASRRYPVVMEVYGGPNTAYVRDYWRPVSAREKWFYDSGVIKVVADTRAAGHNGRAGVDLIYQDVVSVPVADMVLWAEYFKSLPYVDGERIGVEGFSFGGTMTAMLVMTHPESFCCGIAGGGVYDWMLYDSHYTERYMNTPQNNPEGYRAARVLDYVDCYDSAKSYLKLTHGTGDDNVHFQNTLQFVDKLQSYNMQFDLMIYPDGMHGYRGEQAKHDVECDKIFWTNHLKL